MQSSIDRENAAFWDELCGSNFARKWGVADHSPASLRRFDDQYFAYYPYLLPIIRPGRWSGRTILEIGLGYGSVSQQLAESGADYHGLDIAENPVRMVNSRLARLGKPAKAQVGSALAIPFAAESFDAVVSIGCLHHTGDLAKCLREVERVLRPGGSAIVMVYNAYSFREWTRRPFATLRRWFAGSRRSASDSIGRNARAEYDADQTGRAAPETVLTTSNDLRRLLAGFDLLRLEKRNCDPIAVRGITLIGRSALLSVLGRTMGLDLYVEAVKRSTTMQRQAA